MTAPADSREAFEKWADDDGIIPGSVYWDAAMRGFEAALSHQGRVVPVSALEGLCEEWDAEAKDMEAPQSYREACRCFAYDLRAIIEKGEV